MIFHLMLTSYVAYISEGKDLLGLKRGPETNAQCHLCVTKKNDLPYVTMLFLGLFAKQSISWSPMHVVPQEMRLKINSISYQCSR